MRIKNSKPTINTDMQEGPMILIEDIIQDYNGDELKVGDIVVIIDTDDMFQPVGCDPIVVGDTFHVVGGNDDNIVHVHRINGDVSMGLFGERFKKLSLPF